MHINGGFTIAAKAEISGKVLVISLALPIAEIRVVPDWAGMTVPPTFKGVGLASARPQCRGESAVDRGVARQAAS